MNPEKTQLLDFNPHFERDFRADTPAVDRLAGFLHRLVAAPVFTLGVDLSHWNTSVNFSALHASGFEFVILKATESVNYVDPTFEARWRAALSEGLIVGTYHFLRCNYGGINQAERHLETIRPLMEATGGRIIPPACDVETADGAPLSARQACVTRFMGAVRQEIARPALCYSSPSLWQTLTGNMPLDCVGWTAHWTSAAAPSWPAGWPAAGRKFWQFGVYPKHAWVPAVPGVTGEVDVNRWLGSLDELKAFVGIKELSDTEKINRLWLAHPELHNMEPWERYFNHR